MHRCRSGYTLIELVVTVAIVGMLATIAMPFGHLVVQRTKEQELRQALRDIRSAIDAYRRAVDEGRIQRAADASGYPPDLDALTQGVPDLKNPDRRKLYFLRRLPRDPVSTAANGGSTAWGLRSYESPPESPQPGRDVFDVYSLAPGAGLDGVPYRQW